MKRRDRVSVEQIEKREEKEKTRKDQEKTKKKNGKKSRGAVGFFFSRIFFSRNP